MTSSSSILEGIGRVDLMDLADRWWLVTLRGMAAVLFGILTFVAPRSSLYVLVLLFGIYAVVAGVVSLVHAVRTKRRGRRWGGLVFEGIVYLGAGILTLVWPNISALALLFVIAAAAIGTGIGEIVTAVRLRKLVRGEWLLALSGVLSAVIGVLLILNPGAGALAVVFWIGAWAIITGCLLIGLSLRLRTISRVEHELPTGGLAAGV
jgi:uncharacterized membrane protein HdeD (DUF308 family)